LQKTSSTNLSTPTQTLENILTSFGIKAACLNYQQIDNYFFYDLKLNPGAKVAALKKYGDEISLALKSPCKPIIKVLHQEGLVRLEFAGARKNPLKLFDFFTNANIPHGKINCLLGQAVGGEKIWMDLAQNPHMIVAGTTGSGKSTLLHNLISNLFNYNDVELFLVDPKQIEFSQYEKHCGIPVCYTYLATMELLNSLLQTMETRYDQMRNGNIIDLKPIVVIIDEFADIMIQDKDNLFLKLVCRLSQKCRAAKIHLILSTQRPSTNVISGTIKANFPARIACRVASHIDSKVILDSAGAENLLGRGDALLRDQTRQLERFQIAHTTAKEVVKYFRKS
jgi:S-DNA-T family DNA segregation ATPase FtsK/SpoIIIE